MIFRGASDSLHKLVPKILKNVADGIIVVCDKFWKLFVDESGSSLVGDLFRHPTASQLGAKTNV